MGYPLRWNRTDLIYEVTLDTIQGRYLLRPSREARDIILGVIARAEARYPAIRLYAFVFTRDQGTLLISSSDEEQFARFMAYVAGGISRKLGRLLDWSGKLWAGRYRAVPILDEEAVTERLRFVLSRGVADGLVASPRDWPGATCVPALLGSMTIDGTWVDRDAEASLRTAGLEPPPAAYVKPFRVTLAPIPAWTGLEPSELVGRYRAMIDSIEHEHLVRTHGEVMDPVALQQQDPYFRPPQSRTRQRIAALCHATCQTVKDAFRTAYRGFCAAFRAAAGAIAQRGSAARALVAGFPHGSNPRPDLRIPWHAETDEPAQDTTFAAADTVRDESRDEPFGPAAHDRAEPRVAPRTAAIGYLRAPDGPLRRPRGHPTTAAEPARLRAFGHPAGVRAPTRVDVDTLQVTQIFTRPRPPPRP